MKVFVFDPLYPGLITPQNEAALKKAGAEIILTTAEAPLADCKELFAGNEPRILGINPDYVGWSLPAAAFKDIPQLKAIVTQSTSAGWIDGAFAAEKNIPVVNIRNFSTDAVADWAVLMMLNLARRIPLLIKNGFPLNFGSDFQTYQGMNLKGKKAGIVGLGHIGAAIADRCRGLGMEVSYWNRSPVASAHKKGELADLFRESDVIFPCLADNDDTKKVITDDMLRSMKQGAIFASIVHKYYNHSLLIDRVADGSLYGYGFEADAGAFAKYQGNIWAVPAYTWCTSGSMRASMDMFVDAVADAVAGRFPNAVNLKK